MKGYVPDFVRSDSMLPMWQALSVQAPRNSVRNPRFKVRFDVAFQSSCAKTAELFWRYWWLSTPPPPKLNSGVPPTKFPKSVAPVVFVKNSCPLKTCGNCLLRLARMYCPPKVNLCAPRTQLRLSTKL